LTKVEYGVLITIVQGEASEVIMSDKWKTVMIADCSPGGGVGACICIVCEVDDENSEASPGCVAHRI